MNAHAELWNKPWHARLRTLAEGLRANSGDPSTDAAKLGLVRVVSSPAGSWLRRGRVQAVPGHPRVR